MLKLKETEGKVRKLDNENSGLAKKLSEMKTAIIEENMAKPFIGEVAGMFYNSYIEVTF